MFYANLRYANKTLVPGIVEYIKSWQTTQSSIYTLSFRSRALSINSVKSFFLFFIPYFFYFVHLFLGCNRFMSGVNVCDQSSLMHFYWIYRRFDWNLEIWITRVSVFFFFFLFSAASKSYIGIRVFILTLFIILHSSRHFFSFYFVHTNRFIPIT